MKRWYAVILFVLLLMVLAGCPLRYGSKEYGFAREVAEQERQVRMQVVQTAQGYLGYKESDGSHKKIIDRYNSQEVLPVNYAVQYTDKWCATFGSVVALDCQLTDIIPVECGCQRQIELFQALGCWEEDDSYIPLPGDYIFYDSDHKGDGDCTDWADHVGIVIGVCEDTIQVIEGNYNKAVGYRYIPIDDMSIRGFGVPNYEMDNLSYRYWL